MATASVNRSSDSIAMVDTILATMRGCRYGSTTMFGINRIRSVTAEQKARAVKGSKAS